MLTSGTSATVRADQHLLLQNAVTIMEQENHLHNRGKLLHF